MPNCLFHTLWFLVAAIWIFGKRVIAAMITVQKNTITNKGGDFVLKEHLQHVVE